MRFISGTEAITVEHPVFILYGPPGLMKTSLGFSAANPLLLDIDKGAHRAVNRRMSGIIDSWADLLEVTHDPRVTDPYQSVVIDTLGRMIDVMTTAVISEDPKNGRSGNPTQQGWGIIKARFRQWLVALRAMGKDVVIIAHEKVERDGDLRVSVPDVAGGSYGEILKSADYVGYCHMKGNQRVIDFTPSEKWVAKSAGSWDTINVPPPAQATDLVAKLIDRARADLGKISEQSAAALRVVAEWREKIAAFTTPDQINEAVADAKALEPVVSAQVKRLIHVRATELGLTADVVNKKYVAKPVEPAPETTGEAVTAGAIMN